MAEPPFAGLRVTAAAPAVGFPAWLIGTIVPIPPVGKLAVLAARPPRPCRVLDGVAPSREAGMSVLMSAARNVPLLWPTAPVVGAPKPASVEQRKDTSFPFGHVAPHV